ncbi:MAG: HlyD family secretion protein [Gammaproteobacteria bacterium]|nr:HlyD family secretion protein [Gammaproteobacteria bacterium]
MINIKTIQQKISSSRQIQIILSIILVIGIVTGGIFYWLHAQRYISTDNAYVNANIVKISAQVSGQVSNLNVQNNQFVNKGELLFELDPIPFQVAVDKEKAQLAIAEANWKNAQTNTKRVTMLAKNRSLSIQDEDDAIKNLQVATATLQLATASLNKAEFDLHNSKVFAATNGYVSNMTLRVGSVISAFQPLFVVISDELYWVDANFKETELQNISPGQTAEVIVEMYPSHVFKGAVESISGGSGTVFSLLPPQNATGNWIKITQRIPVKIHILNPDPKYPLRIGTTATVKIDAYSNQITTP